MTLKKAQDIVCTDFSSFPAEKLQKYKVNVIDAWRYARGDYGYTDFVMNYQPSIALRFTVRNMERNHPIAANPCLLHPL